MLRQIIQLKLASLKKETNQQNTNRNSKTSGGRRSVGAINCMIRELEDDLETLSEEASSGLVHEAKRALSARSCHGDIIPDDLSSSSTDPSDGTLDDTLSYAEAEALR